MSTPPLNALVLTDQRVRIAELLLTKTPDGNARKFTTTGIIDATALSPSTVCFNMKALASSGWFKVDWEDDIDPYDFDHAHLRRRLFLREGIENVLDACVNDFKRVRPGGGRRQATRPIQFAPPYPEDLDDPDYLPVQCGQQISPGRKELLLYCLKNPNDHFYPAAVGRVIGQARNTVRRRMVQCETYGLMVSHYVPDHRVFRLTEIGLKTTRRLSQLSA